MFRLEIDGKRDFWHGIDKKKVGEYIPFLERLKKKIEQSRTELDDVFGIEDGKFKSIIESIEEEISYAKFYLDMFKRQRDENFNKWLFIKKEFRIKAYAWETMGDCWVKSNGRIKITIDIDKGAGISTRVGFKIENDNQFLKFYERGYGEKEFYKNLRNEESIKRYVEDLKQTLENKFKECLYPRYCREYNSFKQLQQLLHIEGEEE